MQQKILLLASFVKKKDVNVFLEILEKKHKINKDKVFIYEIKEDELLLTYRLTLDLGFRFNIKSELPKTMQIHKKMSTFFTINALNRLIEINNGVDGGNVNHKDFKVDWNQYRDKLLLLKNNKLDIIEINRVFLDNL